MYNVLINILVFCGILLLIALIVAAVQGILILLDVRRAEKEVMKKVAMVSSAVDIVSIVAGGVGGAKKVIGKKISSDGSTITAFMAGLKKGLEVFFAKGGKE
jgi:hypothetical protein